MAGQQDSRDEISAQALYAALRERGVTHRDARSACAVAGETARTTSNPSLERDWREAVTIYRDGRAVEAMSMDEGVALAREAMIGAWQRRERAARSEV